MRKGPLPVFIAETVEDARMAAKEFTGLSFYAMSWDDSATFEMLQGGHRTCYLALLDKTNIPARALQLMQLQPRMVVLTIIDRVKLPTNKL